jgi:hypothetical protein
MSDDLTCFWEEIGFDIEWNELKIWETECGHEDKAQMVPKFCPHCQRTVEVSPGCRRCGSTEHTTSWHDAQDQGKEAGTPVEIQTLNGGDFIRLIFGE